MADFHGALPVRTIRDDEFKVKLVDYSGGSIATTGLNIDAQGRAATRTFVTDGTDFLAINSDGSINIRLDDGDEKHHYGESLALGAGSSANFDYVVADGKNFQLKQVLVGARGAVKVEIGVYDGTNFTTKYTYFQQPALNIPIKSILKILGDGTTAVRVRVTNLDAQASDVYCAIEGAEVVI